MPFIRISSLRFPISSPYSSGQVIDQDEAETLNTLRAERIRSSLGKYIDRLKGKKGELSPQDVESIHARAKDLDAQWTFSAYRAKRQKKNSFEFHLEQVAQERAEAQARRANRADDLSIVRSLFLLELEKPEVREEAERRYETQAQVAQDALDDLFG